MADRRSAKSFKARFSRADGTWSQPIGRSSTSDTRSGFNGPLAASNYSSSKDRRSVRSLNPTITV